MALLAAVSLVLGSSGRATPGAASQASAGGVLNVGDDNPPTSLDPAVGQSGADYPILYLLYDRLIDFNPKTLALTPGLATSWKFTGSKRLTFTLNLRHGVRFQDGSPLTADAVRQSLQRYVDMKVQTDLSDVRWINVVNKYELVIHLKQPYSALPAVLADRAGMIVSPTAVAKEGNKGFAAHPVGAGPFAFSNEASGASIDLTRSKYYWNQSRIHLSAVKFTLFSTPTAMVNALEGGQINFASVPGQDVAALRSHGLTVHVGKSLTFYDVVFNPAVPAVKSRALRVAFNLALNRNAINKVLTNGFGTPEQEPVPAGNPYYDAKDAPLWPYNPAAAKATLAKAGLGNGVNLPCISLANIYPNDYYALVASEEEAVGIHMNLVSLSVPQALQDFNVNHSYGCLFLGWSGRPDPALTYEQNWSSDGAYNPSHFNYGLDGLMAKLNDTYTMAGRKALFVQMNKILKANPPLAPMANIPAIDAYSKDVHNYVPNLQGKDDLSTISVG